MPKKTSSTSPTTTTTSKLNSLLSTTSKLFDIGIGYPCQNRTRKWTTGHTLRLKSLGFEKWKSVVKKNLDDLEKMLQYNIDNEFRFLRIASNIIPFASHPLFSKKVQEEGKFDSISNVFGKQLNRIATCIRENQLRISIHADQFILLNSLKEDIFQKSKAELIYQCDFMNCIGLDTTHKIQIHVGGVYKDKPSSIQRFIQRYKSLPSCIKDRLVIENDDHLFNLKDCIQIHEETGIPILFDNLHHECLNEGEELREAIEMAFSTWDKTKDGIPLMDYSSQNVDPKSKIGKHAETIDLNHFASVIKDLIHLPCDLMLEIKDKESSALKAMDLLHSYSE